MNELIGKFILAFIQGVTEWLPVSSSGHLVLAEKVFGITGGLNLEVALHFGTLMAIFVYFGREITDIIQDILYGRWKSHNARLGFYILIATVPAAIVGYLVKDIFDSAFSNFYVLGFGFAITGALLLISSFRWGRDKGLNWKSALIIGIAQAFAIVPAISRAGATTATGLLVGMKEQEAMKFSFLMSIPVIFGANLLLFGFDSRPLSPDLIWATLLCFFVALGVLHVLYRYVLKDRKNLRWFAGYCFALAIAIWTYIIF